MDKKNTCRAYRFDWTFISALALQLNRKCKIYRNSNAMWLPPRKAGLKH